MFDTCLHRLAVHASRCANAERRPTSVSAAGSLTVQMLLLDVHGYEMRLYVALETMKYHKINDNDDGDDDNDACLSI